MTTRRRKGQEYSSWKLDKHIPIALIIAILAQTAAAVWYAAKLDQRVFMLEANKIEITRLVSVEEKLNGVKESLGEIKSSVARITDKFEDSYEHGKRR
jgi:septation ring formation regulator EzrA